MKSARTLRLSTRCEPRKSDNWGCATTCSVSEEHDLSQGQRLRVCDRHQRSTHQHAVGAPGGTAMELQARWSSASDDLDVSPEHAARVAGAKCLHGRLFCRETARQMRGRVSPLGTIGNLSGGEHALQEAFAVSFENRCHTRDVGGVETNTEDVHDRAPA